MGSPFSKTARNALEELVLNGTTPDGETLHALGIDIKLLEQRHNEIKSVLPHLDGLSRIEEEEYCAEHYTEWVDLVAASNLSGERVIRLIEPMTAWDSSSLFAREYAPIELFLTRTGDWIIWSGAFRQSNGAILPKRLTRHRTVRSMLKRLDELIEPRRRGDHVDFPAFRVHFGLVTLLDKSIEAKSLRLAPQVTMRERFLKSDRENGLLP